MTQRRSNVVAGAVTPLLADLGFKKRGGEIFTIDLTPGVFGWLGLNRATEHRAPGEVEINPVVGVRFQEVERIVAECRGEKFHAYVPATICRPLGYLMPENRYTAWIFAAERAREVAAQMAAAVASFGVPFMRSVVGFRELDQRLVDGFGFDHQIVYRRPVAALLAGDVSHARNLLDEATTAMATRTDTAAIEFRKFAEVLRGRCAVPVS